MITYGLKLWSNNIDLFGAAAEAHAAGDFDFIELYSNPHVAVDPKTFADLAGVPVTIHACHDGGFHEFVIGREEINAWKQVIALADFFDSPRIIVHPGREHTHESFRRNLSLIDDPRIMIENMAGLDIDGKPMFGQDISDLEQIQKIKPICFDFEKAIKAACYQNLDYKAYITEAIGLLAPVYFHISGGDSKNPVDQHTDLSDSDIDFVWIKRLLERLADAPLVFETPKRDGIANDLKNMQYFREL